MRTPAVFGSAALRPSFGRAFALLFALTAAGCASANDGAAVTGDEANVTGGATLAFTSDFHTTLEGKPTAGKPLRVEYALDRLPECRGNVGGGGPGWNITGYYSENGGPAKIFEVTDLSDDGKDRVSAPATVTPSEGGDIAFWFQVTSRWGCSAFDSQYGQNFHVSVDGRPPESTASLLFKQDGSVEKDGELRAGGRVRVRYEQARLPDCRRVERGVPVWTITGFSQVDREQPHTFDTARPEGSERSEIDALIDLPHAGELSFWFQVTSIGGCMKYDSQQGANYTFPIAP